jgi:transposase
MNGRNGAGGDSLPEREELHEPGGEKRTCPCCGKERPEIGEERGNEYDLIPEHVVKIAHIRKKYGPCGGEGSEEAGGAAVLTAAGPEKILPGSDFTNRSTAFFITGKYADGMPFYRMEKMLVRHGLEASRACLSHQAILAGRVGGRDRLTGQGRNRELREAGETQTGKEAVRQLQREAVPCR